MSAPTTTVIFSGGHAPSPRVVGELPEGCYVIAADSGLDHAHALGIEVDLLVGDLDSVTPENVRFARRVERHPVDKDATDLELALEAAAARQQPTIVVAGGGGRLDHLLAEAALIGHPRWAGLSLDAWFGETHLVPVHGGQSRIIAGTPGGVVTLLAMGGIAHGVSTEGLRWRLDGDDLTSGTTRGVSNLFVATEASVRVEAGTVLVIVPGP